MSTRESKVNNGSRWFLLNKKERSPSADLKKRQYFLSDDFSLTVRQAKMQREELWYLIDTYIDNFYKATLLCRVTRYSASKLSCNQLTNFDVLVMHDTSTIFLVLSENCSLHENRNASASNL